jgi:hypothetical protein
MKMKKLNKSEDIHDSPQDEKVLQGDKGILDLPDVEDIPGQENIIPPRLNEFADTTVSSADEEEITSKAPKDDASDVTEEEISLLDKAYEQDPMEGIDLDELALDDKDEEGEPLNEGDLEDDLFGEDLDSPLVNEEESEDEGEEAEKEER